jgi:hypothetical protein
MKIRIYEKLPSGSFIYKTDVKMKHLPTIGDLFSIGGAKDLIVTQRKFSITSNGTLDLVTLVLEKQNENTSSLQST